MSDALLDKQIANGNRDVNGNWLRDARLNECGDCGLPIEGDDMRCPHCGAD